MDLKFVFDIIDAQVKGITEDFNEGLVNEDEWFFSTTVLDRVRNTIQDFINEANKLQGKI